MSPYKHLTKSVNCAKGFNKNYFINIYLGNLVIHGDLTSIMLEPHLNSKKDALSYRLSIIIFTCYM